MFELSKELLAYLLAFVTATFKVTEDEDTTPFRDKALNKLKMIFQTHGFIPVPQGEETKKQKGAKTVAHNTFADDYLRVTSPNTKCTCPIVIKPIWTKAGFLTYYFAPDSEKANSHSQLEGFALLYDSKAITKHEDYELMSIACTCRQMGEDRRNNLAQKTMRMEAKATEQAEKIAAFVILTDTQWNAVKSALMLVDEELVEYVEQARAEQAQA